MVQSNSDFNVFLSKDKYLSVYLICINLISNLDNETILSTEIYNLQKRCGQCLMHTIIGHSLGLYNCLAAYKINNKLVN